MLPATLDLPNLDSDLDSKLDLDCATYLNDVAVIVHSLTVPRSSTSISRLACRVLPAAEDSLNMALRDITVTARDGRVSQLEQVYIRGSMVSCHGGLLLAVVGREGGWEMREQGGL